MKFFFLAYLFTPSGEYLWKDIIEVPTIEVCENMAQAYSKTIINTGNQASFFCLNEDEYYNGRQEEYEGQLNPIDAHEPDEAYLNRPGKIEALAHKCPSKRYETEQPKCVRRRS